jgi:hypothetical protein
MLMPYKDPTQRLAYHRAYAIANREHILGYRKKYYAARKAEYKAYRQANASRRHGRHRANHMRPIYRAYYMRNGARCRARNKHEAFALTLDRVQRALLAGVCEQTGVPFDLRKHATHKKQPFAPSLDKINPRLPYSDSNTQVVTWQYNAAKGEGSDQDLEQFCIRVLRAKGYTVAK